MWPSVSLGRTNISTRDLLTIGCAPVTVFPLCLCGAKASPLTRATGTRQSARGSGLLAKGTSFQTDDLEDGEVINQRLMLSIGAYSHIDSNYRVLMAITGGERTPPPCGIRTSASRLVDEQGVRGQKEIRSGTFNLQGDVCSGVTRRMRNDAWISCKF